LLITPADWVPYLRVKRSRQTRSGITIPTTVFPFVRGLTSTAKDFAARVLDTRLVSADVISGDSRPNLDTAPLDVWIHPLSAFTLNIYTHCLPFASGINNSWFLQTFQLRSWSRIPSLDAFLNKALSSCAVDHASCI
jgi:hypothetical protein